MAGKMELKDGVENYGFEESAEDRSRSFRPYNEENMDTIDLRRSPDREDRLQLSTNEFEVHEDEAPDGKKSRDEEEHRCGWWFFRPDFLQSFRTPKWTLFWLCWASAMQGMVVNGFVNVVITTIERRFGLRSSETGLVAGGYDIASFLCLVPITYFGGRRDASKPKWIGYGILFMALGSFVFALPHFMVPAYRGVEKTIAVCQKNSTLKEDCAEGSQPEYLSMNLWLFVISQLLTGAGSAPLYTLGVTYLDENVTKKMSSLYLGVYYTLSLVGPAVGYIMGGELLKIYTDFLTHDPNEFGLTQNSNVWVGAWWIGFIISGVVCVLIAIPILGMPPALPGSSTIQTEKVSEAHGDSQFEAFRKFRELPRAFRDLIVNPTFSFLNLAGASEGFLISGFAAFMPKLIENEFSISASFAAILMGAITVPAGGGGTFLGGYLVKKLDLKCAGIIKLCIVSTIVSIAFISCFLLSCPNLKFAGLNTPYTGSDEISFTADCNSDCKCSLLNYEPVCGADDMAYYSPCHAGCSTEYMLNDNKVYTNCSCIKRPSPAYESSPILMHFSYGVDANSSGSGPEYDAQNVTCESQCGLLSYFVVLSFFLMVFTFLATMPALSATLRCVQDEQRSFALGIQWLVVRILGTIPAPLIFGFLIDRTCILWESDCFGDGSCRVYDNRYMSRYMFGIAVIGKACSLLFFFCSWWFYVPPSETKQVQSVEKKVGSARENHCSGLNGGAVGARFEA
ncbi:UNVERIFIED_CONTAM: hypothetical protein PYX00_010711 [Menopon gallinae]|uniref:Solute carrier organic anion transporter family member n=1 Tax=Menopon gallinae TaxID=328185 RepID=A0AAW2HGL5_9NEOP